MATRTTRQEPPVLTRQQQIDLIVDGANRKSAVQIRKTFVQMGPQDKPQPGLLARIVRRGDERALDLYLLMRLLGVKEPFDATLPAEAWARALALEGESGLRTVSRTWTRLVRYKLVKRGRAKDMARMTPLMEDGSGDEFERPTGHAGDVYLSLPLAYWKAPDAWYARLNLPAKAMLLISLSLAPGFLLPSGQAKSWYGISADTAERGFAQLREFGLIGYTERYKLALRSKLGYTTERRYTLNAPFKVVRRKKQLVAA